MPHGMMRRQLRPLLVLGITASASQSVFSVHDDLLAYPQYEVILSDSLISDSDAKYILSQAVTAAEPKQSSNSKSLESHTPPRQDGASHLFDPAHEIYELMWLNNEQQLCTIPIVETPQRNETSEAEARAAEQKELARATDRGWELLQHLEDNCLYFVSGWWSYQFCYNGEITQFHQLGPQPGRPPFPPQRDPTTPEFTLGKVKTVGGDTISHEDEWGNRIDTHTAKKAAESSRTELQVKGDTRYLVQKMDGGSICDLTGKPRQVEVQFQCMPHLTHDRIGSIKEVTTCSYLLVVHTPRLCNDIAFMPPKEHEAYPIICRAIVPDDEMTSRSEQKDLSAEPPTQQEESTPQITIGGIPLGGGQFVPREGQRMPIPPNFGQEDLTNPGVETIAVGKSQADGGEVEIASDEALEKLDLDPKIVEELRQEVQRIAREKGWKIEVVDVPGEVREIFGIVEGEEGEDGEVVGGVGGGGDGDEEGNAGGGEKGEGEGEGESKQEEGQGSQEVFKDEL